MAGKRTIAIAMESDLLDRASALNIDVPRVLEDRLRDLVGGGDTELWETENRAAIESFNRYIAEHGTVGNAHRRY